MLLGSISRLFIYSILHFLTSILKTKVTHLISNLYSKIIILIIIIINNINVFIIILFLSSEENKVTILVITKYNIIMPFSINLQSKPSRKQVIGYILINQSNLLMKWLLFYDFIFYISYILYILYILYIIYIYRFLNIGNILILKQMDKENPVHLSRK